MWILKNDFYAGYVRYGDEVHRSDKYPAIWDTETHRAIVNERARRTRGGSPPATCVSGIVYCARCGRAMTACRKKPGGTIRYRCAQHAQAWQGWTRRCHRNAVRADVLIDVLSETLIQLGRDGNVDQILQASVPERSSLAQDIEIAREALARVQQKRERLAIALAEGQIAGDIYRLTDDKYVDELDALLTQITEMQQRLDSLPSPEAYADRLRYLVEEMKSDPAWLRDQDVEQARRALLDAGAIIYVEEGKILKVAFGIGR